MSSQVGKKQKDFMAKIGDSSSDCKNICMTVASDRKNHGEKAPPDGNDLSDQSRTVRLLGRDLLAIAQNTTPPSPGKTNNVTGEDRLSGHPMPIFGSINEWTRPPPLLERGLLPVFGKGANVFGSSASSQLTMFYAGAVHVYNNVPFEKAQAIMLLAGESSSSKPGFVPRSQETEGRTHLPQPNLPSICNMEADLPIARKNSLRSFLTKRHDRITNKAPYASKSSPSEKAHPMPRDEEAQSSNHNSSLSPFPSHLGYFSPEPTNKST